MFRVTVLVLCFMHLVFCELNVRSTAGQFVSEVLPYKELEAKIEETLGNSTEALIAKIMMIDASTKIPNGLIGGSFIDLGNFDECYNIQYGEIYGKYCLGVLPLEIPTSESSLFYRLMFNKTKNFRLLPQPRVSGAINFIGPHFAACIPSNMSATDIPGLIKYREDFCYSKTTEPSLSPGAITTIVILSIFLAIIVASTVFDIYLYYANKNSPNELLLAFSCLSNGRKLLKSSTNKEQILCLNGIKALSMIWVIYGHEYNNIVNAPMSNFIDIVSWEKEPLNMDVINASVSVDTFFVVGGLVTVYTFLKAIDKGVKFNIFQYYLHRYLRLTPALAIMSLITLFLLDYVATGPLWKNVYYDLVEPCERGWWSTLLYITNYVNDGICLAQTWYLSVDMQLFLLTPFLLIPMTKWPKLVLYILIALMFAGCIIPFGVGYGEHLKALLSEDEKYSKLYYRQTYARFGPYVIGMIFGYFIYKIKTEKLTLRLNKISVCILWLILLTVLLACVYAGHDLAINFEEDRWGNAMFLAFNRSSWAVAVAGVIFLCVTGYGGPIDTFLSLPIFQFITKVSYSMYLVHYSVIIVRYSSMKTLIKFSNLMLMHMFWGDFMFTLAFSIILCLSFESPVIILEKYLFGKSTSKKKEESTQARV